MKIRFLIATALLLSGVSFTWNHRIALRSREPATQVNKTLPCKKGGEHPCS